MQFLKQKSQPKPIFENKIVLGSSLHSNNIYSGKSLTIINNYLEILCTLPVLFNNILKFQCAFSHTLNIAQNF